MSVVYKRNHVKGRAVYQIYLAHGIEMPPKELASTLERIDRKFRKPHEFKDPGLNPGNDKFMKLQGKFL